MKFFEKLKRTYKYYKSLGKKPAKKTDSAGFEVRPDYIAFLTCPYPVLEGEQKSDD